jgi:hypothetical protein
MANTSTLCLVEFFKRLRCALLVPALAAAVTVAASAPPKFFPDDPIWTDDDQSLDASKTGLVEDSNGYDFVVNTFAGPGEERDVRAMNVNTIDEVPDSSWFTNRIGRRQLSIDEIVRGPDSLPACHWKAGSSRRGSRAACSPGFA